MRVTCGKCKETIEIPQSLEGMDTTCPECGAVVEAKDNPIRYVDTKAVAGKPSANVPDGVGVPHHVDTHKETVDKFKADPEVKSFLKGVESDTMDEMKAEAKANSKKKPK